MNKENIKLEFYTQNDCIESTGYVNYEYKVLVIKPDYFSADIRIPAFQIFCCIIDGSIEDSFKDNLIIGFTPASGLNNESIHRSDVLGILKPELVQVLGLAEFIK